MSQRLGRYTLVRSLATGGMAEVFHAKTEGPGGFEKDVALKRVLPHLQIADGADGFAELFLDEARLAARLTHPNVVQVFDFGEADGAYFLAMELLDGVDVSAVLRASKRTGLPVPLDVAVHCIAEAAAGLHYAHTLAGSDGAPLRLVHRDISPSNLFLTRHGEVKVLDFGIAKAEGQLHVTNVGMLKGKHAYVPPEQVHGMELTAQADIWSLGLTLYELCCGVRFFDRENPLATLRAVLEEEVPPPSAQRADVPAALDAIVLRCVARDLNTRYATAADVRADLQELLGTTAGRDMVAAYVTYVSDVQSGKAARPPSSSGLADSGSSRPRTPAPFADVATNAAPASSTPLALDVEPSSLPDRGVRGTLDQLSIPDIVQMIEMGKKSAIVEVWPTGGAAGRLELDGGQVLYAEAGAYVGDDAFYALCRAREGTFHLLYRSPSGARNMSAPTAFLLLEAMRRLDESSAASVPAPFEADDDDAPATVVSTTLVPSTSIPTSPLGPAAVTLPEEEPFGASPAAVAQEEDLSLEVEVDLNAEAPFSRSLGASSIGSAAASPAVPDMAALALEGGHDPARPEPSPFTAEPWQTPSTGTDPGPVRAAIETTAPSTVKALVARAGMLPVPVAILVLRGALRAVAASGGDRRLAASTVVIDVDGGVRVDTEHDDDDDAQRAAYESPEEAAGQSLDARSRLFSASTLLFEMLTGKNPFLRPTAAATRAAVRDGDRPLLLVHAGAAPVLVARLVERMWRTAAKQRPQTAAEALAILEPLALRLEQIYPGVLTRALADPVGTERALAAEQARRDVALAAELSSGSGDERRQAGFALMRARAACPDDGRAGARLLRMAQEEGWFVSGSPTSSVVDLEGALARSPYDEKLLRELRREAEDEGRFLHAAAALVRYTVLKPADEEAGAALRSLTGAEAAPFGVAEVPVTSSPDAGVEQADEAPPPKAWTAAEMAAFASEPAPDEPSATADPRASAATASSSEVARGAAASDRRDDAERRVDSGRAPSASTSRPVGARSGGQASSLAATAAPPSRRAAVFGLALVVALMAGGGLLVLRAQATASSDEDATPTPVAIAAARAVPSLAERQQSALHEATQLLYGREPSAAIRALSAVVEMDPKSAAAVEARFGLAQASLRAGDVEGAAAAYRGVLDHTKPDDDRHHRAERLLAGLPQPANSE